ATYDERATIEFLSGSFESCFSRFECSFLQTIAQRDKRVIGVVVDNEDRATAADAACRMNLAIHFLHRRVEYLHISDSYDLHVAQLAECPAGVVVNVLLRIARAPILIIEQNICYATVRLVHAYDVTA